MLAVGTGETGDSGSSRIAPRVELALSRVSNMTHPAASVEKSSVPLLGGRSKSFVLHLLDTVSRVSLVRFQPEVLLRGLRSYGAG
jgi:hypothetical protein